MVVHNRRYLARSFNKEKIVEQIASEGSLTRLALVLATHFPHCPICRQKYRVSNEWADELLQKQRAHLSCGCPDEGWEASSSNPFLKALVPEQIFKMQRRVASTLGVAGKTLHNIITASSKEIVIEEVRQENQTVIRMVLVNDAGRLRPAFTIITENLALISPEECGELAKTWSEHYAQFFDEERRSAEALVKTGKAVKVRLLLGERQKLISAQKTGRHTSFYVVDDTYRGEAAHQETWYCYIVRIPEKQATPNLTTLIIRPFLKETDLDHLITT